MVLKRGFAGWTEGQSRGGRRVQEQRGHERALLFSNAAKKSGLSSKHLGGTRRNAVVGPSLALCTIIRLIARYNQPLKSSLVENVEDFANDTVRCMDALAEEVSAGTDAAESLDAERRAVARIFLAVLMARQYMDDPDSPFAVSNECSKWVRAEVVSRFAEAAAWPPNLAPTPATQPQLYEWITSADFRQQFMPPPERFVRRVPVLQSYLIRAAESELSSSRSVGTASSSCNSALSDARTVLSDSSLESFAGQGVPETEVLTFDACGIQD